MEIFTSEKTTRARLVKKQKRDAIDATRNSEARDATLQRAFAIGESIHTMVERMNALPGAPTTARGVRNRIKLLGLLRSDYPLEERERAPRDGGVNGGSLGRPPGSSTRKHDAFPAETKLRPLAPIRDGGLSLAARLMQQEEREGLTAPADDETILEWSWRHCGGCSNLDEINRVRVVEYGLPKFVKLRK